MHISCYKNCFLKRRRRIYSFIILFFSDNDIPRKVTCFCYDSKDMWCPKRFVLNNNMILNCVTILLIILLNQ